MTMIKSMTGFGKGEAKSKYGVIKAEVRSVNHKFLEFSVKLPEVIAVFEDKIREMAAGSIKRGKVNLSLIYEDGVASADKIVVDEEVAKAYYKQISHLKKKINVEGSIRLDQIITLPGVIKYEPKETAPSKIWQWVEGALTETFKKLDEARKQEGRAIDADLKKRIRTIGAATKVINERAQINIKAYRERLKKSISDISKEAAPGFDKGRMEQEVALYAKNSDVTEEITRICAHLKNLRDTIDKDAEAGKKIDFIAQELHREINTVGSKSGDFKISQKVILIKSEIDKLREQAKNIE